MPKTKQTQWQELTPTEVMVVLKALSHYARMCGNVGYERTALAVEKLAVRIGKEATHATK